MIKHNIDNRFFHGCGDCRDCCNGKLFSMGEVTQNDFNSIVKLFPTVINIKTNKMMFFYSLVPLVGCHYLRDNKCSVYDTITRPNTCLNYPFGFDKNAVVQQDTVNCQNLNQEESDYPTLIDGYINPQVMNDFFTETQYISTLNKDHLLDDFITLLLQSDSLLNIPKFKTTDGQLIDINEIETNRDMKIINVDKIKSILERQKNNSYNHFIEGHLISIENFPQFGKRLLEQI